MKQLYDISKAILNALSSVRLFARDLGEPVSLTEAECAVLFDTIRQDALNGHRAYLVVDIKKKDITFTHNTEGVFGIKNLTLEKFFWLIHTDYLADYLNWATAANRLINQKSVEPMRERYRIILPIKLPSKKYYWFVQDSIALQVDSRGKVVSHLNYYEIVRPFNADEKLPLTATIFDGTRELEDWAAELQRIRFTTQPFLLTNGQRLVIEVFLKKPNVTNEEVAKELELSKETVNTYNRQILARARDAFPTVTFKNLKSVIEFVLSLGLLSDNSLLIKPKKKGNTDD